MKDKVLIRKQSSGVQQFQTIGGQAPSFMDLARRVRDPNAGRMERLGAGLGLAGKVGAGLGTVFQTAHQLQGGNALAPLGMGYTYQGLDPTAGMRNAVSEEQQIADKVNQMRINQQATQRFQEMQQPQEEAVPSTSTTDFPNRSATLEQLSELDPMAEETGPQHSPDVVSDAAQALHNMPLQSGQSAPQAPQNTDAAHSLAGFGLEMQPTGQAQPQQPTAVPTGVGYEQTTLQQDYSSQQPQNPALQPHQVPPNNPNFRPQPYMSPQGNPYPLGTEESREWAAQQAWGNRPNFTRYFATQVLDEFGEMIHKADPHVAGLLAFRVYMDKVMKE